MKFNGWLYNLKIIQMGKEIPNERVLFCWGGSTWIAKSRSSEMCVICRFGMLYLILKHSWTWLLSSTWTVYCYVIFWVLSCLTSTQIAWLIPSNLGWMLPCCIIVVEADSSISTSALAKFPLERKGTCPKQGKFGETPSNCRRTAKG